MSEEWRSVPGFEGVYDVSSEGRVRSWLNNKWGKRSEPKILLAPVGNHGYPKVNLRGTVRLVHHLVAEAFLGPRPPGADVAHQDGDRTNARLDNLRYATKTGNANDKRGHGTHVEGSRHGMAKLTEDAVREMRLEYAAGVGQPVLAEKYGVSRGTVSRVVNAHGWTHVAA